MKDEKGGFNGFIVDDSIEFVTYPQADLSKDSRGGATRLDSYVIGWVHGCQGCNRSFRVVDFDALALPVLTEVLR